MHVQAEGGVDGIGADEHARAGSVGLLRRGEIALDVVAQVLLRLGREVVHVVGAVDIMLIVIDGRHVPDALAHQFGDGGVVHVGGVFERVGPGANGVARAGRPVGVHRDFAPRRVRRVDDRLHLLIADGLRAGDVVGAAGRAIDLHPVRAGIDDGLGQLHGFGARR